jgi:hypothetical protein
MSRVMPPLKPLLKVSVCEISWAKFPKMLMNNSTNKMTAKIIQPRLLRGFGGGGGVMTGGGVNGGGAPDEAKDDISITREH